MFLEHFYMIDTVDDLSLEKGTISCSAKVPEESSILRGHFPGFPIVPGVILTETIAQSAGYLCYADSKGEQMPFLVGIEKTSFKGFVRPGQQMKIDVEQRGQRLSFTTFKGRITVKGELVCEARIKLRTLPFPCEQLKTHMQERCSFVGLDDYGSKDYSGILIT